MAPVYAAEPWGRVPADLRQERPSSCAVAALRAVAACFDRDLTEAQVIELARDDRPGRLRRLIGVPLDHQNLLTFLGKIKVGFQVLKPQRRAIDACLEDGRAVVMIFEQYRPGYVQSWFQRIRTAVRNTSFHTVLLVARRGDEYLLFDPGWARGGWQWMSRDCLDKAVADSQTFLVALDGEGDGLDRIVRDEGVLYVNRATGRWSFFSHDEDGLSADEEVRLREYEHIYSPFDKTVAPFEYVVNVTNRCPLDCPYCYANAAKNGQDMPPEVFRQIWQFAHKIHGRDPVSIILHGGEPLLVVRNLLPEIDRACESGANIECSMQSSGVGLTEELAAELARRKIEVGISLDGPPELHNLQRGKHEVTMRSIRMLTEAGMPPGVLATITKQMCARIEEVIDFFVSEGLYKVAFSTMFTHGRGNDVQTQMAQGHEMATAYVKLWHRLLHYRRQGIPLQIREFNTLLLGLTSNLRPTLCGRTPCAAGVGLLGVDTDGTAYPCDLLIPHPEHQLGPIGGLTVGRIAQHLGHEFFQDRPDLVPGCRTCKWQTVCGRGCPAENYWTGTDGVPSHFCDTYSTAIEEMAVGVATDDAAKQYVQEVVLQPLVGQGILRRPNR